MSNLEVRSFSEKELDRAFAVGLREDPGLLTWLVNQTKFAGCEFDIVVVSR